MIPILCRLFNNIFDSGFYPDNWSKGCIVPIFKKGEMQDLNNYRGITLVSCLAKLFTSIINTRLLEWDQRYNIITDAQFGFKPGVGTIDAIFVLQNLISRTLKNKKRLYCCFVDYTKAFDLIDRSKLWYKLQMEGFGGKLLRIIKSLYKNVRACVKHKGTVTETFRISA